MCTPSIEEIINYFNNLPQRDQKNLSDLLASELNRGVIHSKVTTKQIDDSIGDKIEKGFTLITDKNGAYRRFAKKHRLNLKQVLASAHIDRRDRRIHIQHVKATHSKFRDFIGKHSGVSFKYLEKYLKWFCYMKDYDPMSDKIGAWLQDLIGSALPNEIYLRLKNQPIF